MFSSDSGNALFLSTDPLFHGKNICLYAEGTKPKVACNVSEHKDALSALLDIDTESDENVNHLVNELTTANNIETKTNVSRIDIIRISKAIHFSRRYGIKPLDVYTRKVMLRLLVSVDRAGRKDIVDALSNVFRFNLEKQKAESVKV
jgi:hypothetical protein